MPIRNVMLALAAITQSRCAALSCIAQWGIDDYLSYDHPFAFGLHGYGKDALAAQSSDIDRIFSDCSDQIHRSRSRALANQAKIGHFVDLSCPECAVASNLIQAASRYAQQINGRTSSVVLIPKLTEKELEVIAGAFELIRSSWPELYEEISVFLKALYFFEAVSVIGFVDYRLHGTIFLRRDCIRDAVQLAEEIIHESSHIRLNAILAHDELFNNSPNEVFHSPLRRDPRPMFGLFHQLFVLARLKHFYSGFDYPSRASKLEKITTQFQSAYRTVSLHAKLTESGAQIISSLAVSFPEVSAGN